MADTTFVDPAQLEVEVDLVATYSHAPAAPVNPALDQTYDAALNNGQGIPAVLVDLTGTWFNVTVIADPIELLVGFPPAASIDDPTSLAPIWIGGTLISAAPLEVILDLGNVVSGSWLSGPVFITGPGTKANWLQWSNIGVLDFTILKDNLAGERPLDWKGTIWALKWLGDKIIAYGQNGVSILTPAGNAFGLETIMRRGLRSKQAVAATHLAHYFIDKDAQLWELGSDGLHFLNYSEYLSALVSPVLTWDPIDNLLYLCDGTTGFVYQPLMKSLGQGPPTITGVGIQDGVRYITAPVTISTPLFEVATDIYDLGSRHGKMIQSIEAGINTAVTLQVSIEFRQHIGSSFLTTNWYTMDSRGVRYLNCYGYEFRFHLKALSADWFRLDYLKVNGLTLDH